MDQGAGTSIFLLGRPRASRDGTERPARGRKPWAILGYLARSRAPQSREHLAGLFFGKADDPMGALRWNLAEVRKLIGHAEGLASGAVSLQRSEDLFIDVDVLDGGAWQDAISLPTLGAEFLDGVTLPGCASFETWLLAERRYLTTRAQSVLREGAQALLADDRATEAAVLAARLVALDPLEDSNQELLIRSLALSGDRPAAQAQLQLCESLFRRELGVEPSGAVRAAAVARMRERPTVEAGSADALLEAAQAALDAGATASAIETLRHALSMAVTKGDRRAEMAASFSLGNALVRAVRGADEEGAIHLRRAWNLADELGAPEEAAKAITEVAYVEFLRGDYELSQSYVAAALERDPSPAQRSAALIVLGAVQTEIGRYAESLENLRRAEDLARSEGQHKRLAYCLAWIARLHLLRHETDEALREAERSLDLAQAERWTAFLPWPESFVAEAHLVEGRIEEARLTLDHAYPLACHLQDPCWEGVTTRALGLLEAQEGRGEAALDALQRAAERGRTFPDAYRWVFAYCLDALADAAVRFEHPDAPHWVAELEAVAGRHGMRELIVSARIHAASLGEKDALAGARMLARDIDNPYLEKRLGIEADATG